MTKQRWIILIIALAAVALIGWRVTSSGEDTPAYETEAAKRGPITDAITANGVINPTSIVNVGTQVSGTVIDLNADFNDRVVKGQVLLRLDPALFATQLAASEAQAANARAQAQLQRENVRRAAELVAKDYISRQEYETIQAASRGAAAQLRQAEAVMAQNRANLDFSVIRAPVAGVIISREIDLGQTVAAAFSTPVLFKIAPDLSAMRIEAAVAEADIARIKPGQRVTFSVDAYDDRKFEGKVSQIRLNPVTQQNVVTYTVVVDAANNDGDLLPGMTVDASFLLETRKDVLLLPNGALGFRPKDYVAERGLAIDEAVVFVAIGTPAKPEARRIRLGITAADVTEVKSGPLKAGDKIITGLDTTPTGMFSGPPSGRKEDGKNGEGSAPRASGAQHGPLAP